MRGYQNRYNHTIAEYELLKAARTTLENEEAEVAYRHEVELLKARIENELGSLHETLESCKGEDLNQVRMLNIIFNSLSLIYDKLNSN